MKLKNPYKTILKKLPKIESQKEEELFKRKKENKREGWMTMGYALFILIITLVVSLITMERGGLVQIAMSYSFMSLGFSGAVLFVCQSVLISMDSYKIDMELRIRKLEDSSIHASRVDHS